MLLLDLEISDLIVYMIVFVVSVAIAVFLTRWIFRVDTIAYYLKIQTDLLIKIAQHNRVPIDDINQALGLNISDYSDTERFSSSDKNRGR